MSDPIPITSPGQKLRSGAIGWVGLAFCAATLLALAALFLLKPG